MGATHSLRDTDSSGQAMEATAGALLEADRRTTDPSRKYKFWRQVISCCSPAGKRAWQFRTLEGWRHCRSASRWAASTVLSAMILLRGYVFSTAKMVLIASNARRMCGMAPQ